MFLKKIFLTLILSVSFLYGQHRGDNLSFQGLNDDAYQSVRASSMGGAFVAQSGLIDAMFFNPAGLSGISSLTFSVAANSYSKTWFENQNYRPNRYFVTLPFYLEGLYIPDPAENGMFDHKRMWQNNLIDSSYVISFPELGLDPFSEEAADWKKTNSAQIFNHFSVAYPFELSGMNFTAALAYGRSMNIEDYDRNKTFLDPHIGYYGYGDIGRVNGKDTLVVNWYDYQRSRVGKMNNIVAALSYQVNEELSVGVGAKIFSGDSEDKLTLDKIGYFNLVNQNQFRFSYDTAYQHIKGVSDYSSTQFNLGFNYNSKYVSVGININLPYSLTRDYSYTKTILDTNGISTQTLKGSDKINFPATFNFGVNFKPAGNLNVELDYTYAPMSKAEFDLSTVDTTFQNWVDQHKFNFGIDYAPWEFLSLQAGYSQIPSEFVPEGSAIRDSGPKAETISAGFVANTGFGKLLFGYQYRVLRYYDSYYSNTNYNTIKFGNILLGYQLSI